MTPEVVAPGLVRGCRVAVPRQHDGEPHRLTLSAGTSCLEGRDASPTYVPSAFVPRLPWRGLSASETAALTGASSWDTGTDVAVVRMPDDVVGPVLALLDEAGVRQRIDPTEYVSVARHPRWRPTLERVREHVSGLSGRAIADSIYFRMTDADLPTVTKDEFGIDSTRFVGMHLDSWDGLPFRHRHRSRNRLCINLGREPRYSLFVNLSLCRMFEELGLRDPEDVRADFRGLYLGQRFMRRFADYPVVRLRIDPGEAYVLPTDNMIHDASTAGTTSPDITLTFLGFFAP